MHRAQRPHTQGRKQMSMVAGSCHGSLIALKGLLLMIDKAPNIE